MDDPADLPDPALGALQEATWRRLARATHDRHAGWRHPALASVDAAGAPRVRTLVLRGVDPAANFRVVQVRARSLEWLDLRMA